MRIGTYRAIALRPGMRIRSDRQLDFRGPMSSNAERNGSAVRKVDDSIALKRTAVVDSNEDRPVSSSKRDTHPRSERQRAMCRCHGVHIEALSVGGAMAVETSAIPGRKPRLMKIARFLCLRRLVRRSAFGRTRKLILNLRDVLGTVPGRRCRASGDQERASESAWVSQSQHVHLRAFRVIRARRM